MAKAKRKKTNMDWKPVAAGLLILPLVYGTAKGTLPYLQPALERAALWSAGLSFQTQLPEEEARSQTVNQSSIEFLAQHDAGDWNSPRTRRKKSRRMPGRSCGKATRLGRPGFISRWGKAR